MRHIEHRMRQVAAPTAVLAALAASACAAPPAPAADAFTARLVINGQEVEPRLPVQCTQRGWLWTIETLPPTPGFTAIVQTGATIEPQIMRISDLAGFTGSWAGGEPETQATIEGSTFHLSGTAHGSFADRPTKPADVEYRMEARC
ncbi:lipoprotein LpqH [Mycolicibacterium boenickei]